jgi:stage II sporulation protein D
LATTEAERRVFRQCGVALLLLAPASCVSGSKPTARPVPQPLPAPLPTARAPTPAGRDPEVRIGLLVGAGSVSVGGGAPLAVTQPDGSHLWMIPPGETWQVVAAGNGVTLASRGWTSSPLESVTLAPSDPGAPVMVNGRPYRGIAMILRDGTGLTVVNRLGMESYLPGVISAEMGRRDPGDREALRAQAVVSRTYALRNLGRWKAQGFDLTGTVADQVYTGAAGETAEGRAAVADTRGQVLTYGGSPIDAFFYSTCGGRTAEGVEVFKGAARPYLRSIADQADDGSVYCRISPRYRWREEWTGDALRNILQRSLPPIVGVRSEDVRQVTDLRVARRTRSGRVGEVAIGLGGPEIKVDGPAIRQVIRLNSGEPLRSNAFTLVATGAGQRVTHLTVDGMGAGHGVGFCQWGAVGRARAGQRFEQILMAYFPGTTLERRY